MLQAWLPTFHPLDFVDNKDLELKGLTLHVHAPMISSTFSRSVPCLRDWRLAELAQQPWAARHVGSVASWEMFNSFNALTCVRHHASSGHS